MCLTNIMQIMATRTRTRIKQETELARFVKLRRAHMELTQEALATKIGKSQPTVSGIEDGTRGLDPEDLPAMARALGCTVSELKEKAGYVIAQTETVGEVRIKLPNDGWYVRPAEVKENDPIDQMLMRFAPGSQTQQ